MNETVGFEGSKGGLDFNKIVSKVSFRNGVSELVHIIQLFYNSLLEF